MYYTIYQTTNLINGHLYIGKHKTKNPLKDRYIGSGTELKKAIQEFGKENFSCEILFYAFKEEDAFLFEKELVDTEFVRRLDTYNLRVGGHGGYTMTEVNRINMSIRMTGEGNPNFGKAVTEERKKKQSIAMSGRVLTEEHKENISKSLETTHPNLGKPHSEEVKLKIRLSNLGKPRSEETKRNISEGHKGLKQTKETIEKRVKYHIGSKRSDEAKLKMSEAKMRAPIEKCPHCDKEGKRMGGMLVHHFDNCKHKDQTISVN